MTRRLARCLVLVLFGLAVLVGSGTVQASPPPMRRLAVVVGSNDPPAGQVPLRFAHDDASELAAVLEQVGGFSASDVQILLDPRPADLLTALDGVAKTAAEAGGNVLFVFYYSGHSDGHALFPHGEPLALADVRERVERLGARIRVGILDTCRGGSWTQTKGLTPGPPLPMADLLNVDTEGTALVSSSSGIENAHEAEAVHGSFFTHYLAAGLRGAADIAGDGNVTLQEAFDYARERTVGASARLAKTPQHPSFELALRGRQDIVLTTLVSSTSALQVTAARAPVEIIQLSTGVTVADAPAAPGPVRVALPPGRYLVRAVVSGRVYTKEVLVRPGETATLVDAQLEATGEELAMKGLPDPTAPLSLWGSRGDTRWLLHLSAGAGAAAAPPTNHGQNQAGQQSFNSFSAGYSLWYRITDRLSWSVPWPAFSYRFGTPGTIEVMPYVGVSVDGWNSVTGFSAGLRGDLAARIWTARHQWISLAGGVTMPTHLPVQQVEPFARVGYGGTIRGLVTLSASIGMDRDYVSVPSGGWQYDAEWLRVGGAIGVRVAPKVSVDLTAGWSTQVQGGSGSYPGFLAGTTIAF